MNKAEQYFMETVRSGSLMAAAQKLYISQPSLTKFIQRLEKQVGATLFDRSVSPMRLSDAGQVYYEFLLEQEQREQAMRARISQVSRMECGTLRLGMPLYFAQCYLPDVLEAFAERYPRVQVELLEASGEALEQAVLTRQIDLAVLHLPLTHSGLTTKRLFSERILLAVPGEGAVPAQVHEGELPALDMLSYLLPAHAQKLGRFATEFFSSRGLHPQVRLRTQNVVTMLSMVAKGMGAGFAPEGGLDAIHPQLLQKLQFYYTRGMEMTVCAIQCPRATLPAYGEHFVSLMQKVKDGAEGQTGI